MLHKIDITALAFIYIVYDFEDEVLNNIDYNDNISDRFNEWLYTKYNIANSYGSDTGGHTFEFNTKEDMIEFILKRS